jgi:hypothetical protein
MPPKMSLIAKSYSLRLLNSANEIVPIAKSQNCDEDEEINESFCLKPGDEYNIRVTNRSDRTISILSSIITTNQPVIKDVIIIEKQKAS